MESIFSRYHFQDAGSNRTSVFHFDREQLQAGDSGSVTPKRLGHECFAFVGKVTVTIDWLGQGYSKVVDVYINRPMNAGRAKKVEQQNRRCPVRESSTTLDAVLVRS